MNLRILGPIEVDDDHGVPRKLGKRMERALLALLILHTGRTVSTDACIEALWPDRAPSRPDASLHTLIARLRGTLEPGRAAGAPSQWIKRDAAGYRLDARHDMVDSRRFAQAAERGRTLLAAGDAAGAHRNLTAALAEWRGPAFGEFAYEPFAEHAAMALEELRVGALEADLAARVALGVNHIIADLEAFVAENPLREHAWSSLLIALYRSGRQTEALRRAEDLRRTLAEVGLEPSPWVRRTVEAILAHDPLLMTDPACFGVDTPTGNDDAPTTASSPAPTRATPALPRWWQPSERFIGRRSELSVTRDTYRRCQQGDVRIVIVCGEPGIGKSSYAIEAAERMQVSGATVLAGRTSPTSSVPFEPVAEALGRLVAVTDGRDIAQLGEHARRLARLVPSQGARLGPWEGTDVERSDVERSDVDRQLLFDAVAALVARRTTISPVVLVIDDLQWADPATLNLLDHLLRSDRSSALLIIVTVRSADLDDARLRGFLESWYRTGVAECVELHGLDPAEIAALIDPETDPSAAAPGSTPAFAAHLHAVTGGNPFFVVEMARHFRDDSGAFEVLPESVQVLVRSRLDRLDAAHRRVLQAAALDAPRIDIGILAEVFNDQALVTEAVDSAVAGGLLIERSHTVLFQHDLVRAVLDAEIGPAQRAGWHRAIGDALVRRAGPRPALLADRIAHHYVGAAVDGGVAEAVRYAQLAGDLADEAFAFASSAQQYSSGLLVARAAGAVTDEAVADLALSLIEARRKAGDMDLAASECREFLDGIAPHASLDQLHRYSKSCVRSAWSTPAADAEAFGRGLARIEERLAAEGPERAEDVVRLGLARGILELVGGDPGAAAESYGEVFTKMSDDWPIDLKVLVVDTAVLFLGERIPIADRCAHIEALYAQVRTDPLATLEQQQLMASQARWGALTTADIPRALELTAVLEEQAGRLGMARYLAGVAQRRSSLEIVRGHIERAEQRATEALEYRPDEEFEEGYLAQLAMIRLHQGRVGELLGNLDAAPPDAVPPWSIGRALLLAEVGERDRAAEAIDAFIANLGVWERDMNWLASLALATYALDTIGDGTPEAISALSSELGPHVGRVAIAGQSALILGPVELLLGMLTALGGDPAEAIGYLGAADAVLDALEADALKVRREVVHAEILGAHPEHGTAGEARHHAQAARALADQLGVRGTIRDRVDRIGSGER